MCIKTHFVFHITAHKQLCVQGVGDRLLSLPSNPNHMLTNDSTNAHQISPLALKPLVVLHALIIPSPIAKSGLGRPLVTMRAHSSPWEPYSTNWAPQWWPQGALYRFCAMHLSRQNWLA